MDTTNVEFRTAGHAKEVEECRCPPGYTGLSCCNCNGHASACDPISGHCLSCQHNTEGPQCDKCRPGFFGDPTRGRPDDCKPCPARTTRLLDGSSTCDNRGTVSSSSRPCNCKNNVAGTLCDECKPGFFHLSEANPEGCLQCFCMGVTKQCASSTWNRDQVTAYGGELRYTVRFEPRQRSLVIDGQPDVVLQGNGIFLEHFSNTKPAPRVPQTVTVTFRESAWRRADGQPCTREHLLMALADVTVFMIRATYADNMAESSISDIRMDIAVPHTTGNVRALEVEECACPQGYRGPSCQDCAEGYTRTSSGLYLGTCERCDCHGHASSCDPETGACLQCLHNTEGPRCDRCQAGYYGNPARGGAQACQPCPCPGTSSSNQFSSTCYLESDGQPTCDSCPPGYSGRRCEREERSSADSCGDPLQTEDFFPVGCGAEAVFNFSLEKEILPDGSGDDDDEDEDFVTYIRTTQSPKRTRQTTLPAVKKTTAIMPLMPSKNAPRLPPRFTPSPEIRHSSFQHLLRLHLSSFNQRLSMLESNTLDMKEGIRTLQKQQSFLSAQMKQLLSLHSTGEKTQKVAELEQNYTEMEDRLGRLEGRLEILIDGFTALAQEMNRMKRRHISRSTNERKILTTTVALPFYTTTQTPTTAISTKKQSIQTPRSNTVKNRSNSNSEKLKKGISSGISRPKATTQPKKIASTKSKVRTSSITPTSTTTTASTKAKIGSKKVTESKKSHLQTTKTVRTNQKQRKEVTKFQLDPPSHSPRPRKQPNKMVSKKDSKVLVKDNGHSKKAVISDAPQTKPNRQQKPVQSKNSQNTKEARKLVSKESDVVSSKKSSNSAASKKRSSATSRPKRTTPPPKIKTTTAKKKLSSVVKRKSNGAPKPPRKESTKPGVFDLLRLLNGDQKSSKQKANQDASLHVVLGRLAIP
ncbi:hypothetical protein WMY93_028026 [Mugilogobius chulae]|uniref:Uncharacterized protein n=1 Tax=Mugilogobius chulae TaxID=88201 RepID=A0AAW0MUP1_9GOBI